MCDQAVNDYSAIQFVLDSYITQKMCDKAVNICPFVFNSVPDQFVTQKMCDKAVDFYLITLKFVPDWFVTNKMLEKLVNSKFSIDDMDDLFMM